MVQRPQPACAPSPTWRVARLPSIRGTSNERAVAAQLKRRQLNTDARGGRLRRARRSQRSRPARPMRSPATDCCWSAPSRKQRTRARWRCFPTSSPSSPTASSCRAAILRCGSRSTPLWRRSTRSGEIDEIFRRWFGQFGPPPAIIDAAYPPRLDPRVRPCAIRGKAGRAVEEGIEHVVGAAPVLRAHAGVCAPGITVNCLSGFGQLDEEVRHVLERGNAVPLPAHDQRRHLIFSGPITGSFGHVDVGAGRHRVVHR